MSNQYPFGHPKYGTQGPITEKEYNSINFRNKDINQITQKKLLKNIIIIYSSINSIIQTEKVLLNINN